MIHSVYFWLTEEAQSKREEFEAALTALVQIKEIDKAYFGKPADTAERPVTDHSFDYNLTLVFATQEDHDAYQVDPDHDVFIEQCKTWWAKVVVYDTATID